MSDQREKNRMQDQRQDQPEQTESQAGALTSGDAASAEDLRGAQAEGAGTDGVDPEEVGEPLVVGFESVANKFEQFADEPTLENAVGLFGPLLLDIGLAIVGLIVLVVAASIIGRWVQRLTHAGLRRIELDLTVVNFLSRMAKYAIWILAVPIALELFGIRTTSIAAVIGATGLAIGLAMQGSLSNIAAGIMLLVLRPFRLGDWVQLDDTFGIVEDVGIFYTHINTFDRKLVILPNSQVLGAKIEHYTATNSRRVDVPIGVAYGTDLNKAMEVLQQTAKSVSRSPNKDDEPFVILIQFGASSIDFEVRVWSPSEEYIFVRSEAVLAIEKALSDAGINIPFPQRTLSFLQPLRVSQDDSASDDEAGEQEDA